MKICFSWEYSFCIIPRTGQITSNSNKVVHFNILQDLKNNVDYVAKLICE